MVNPLLGFAGCNSPAAFTRSIGAASAAVRRVQTGYLRYYAALLLVGVTGLGAYFLISA